MYETLGGSATSRQHLLDNNYSCQFQSAITNSHHILSANHQSYSIDGLSLMLQSRNARYQARENYFSPGAVADACLQLSHPSPGPLFPLNRTEAKECQPCPSYDARRGDILLDQLQQSFCKFGLHSDLAIDTNPIKSLPPSAHLIKIAKSLRELNKGETENDGKNLAQKYSILKLLEIQMESDPYFSELKRLIKIAQSCSPSSDLFSRICYDEGSEQLQFFRKMENEIDPMAQRHKKMYLLFITQAPLNRPKLDHLLYRLSQTATFDMIRKYDKLVDRKQSHSWQDVERYHQDLSQWASQQQSTPFLKCLVSMMSLKAKLVINTDLLINLDDAQKFDAGRWLLGLKLTPWLTMPFQDQTHQKQLRKEAIECFMTSRLVLSASTPYKQLRLLMYSASFRSICESHKVLLLLLICMEPQTFNELLNVAGEQLEMDHYRKQLVQLLMTLSSDPEWTQFITNCIGLVGKQDRPEILLANRELLERVDWQQLVQQIPEKREQRELIRCVVLRSIKMYRNTGLFLNTGLTFEIMLPYFEIQMLIEGFAQILTCKGKLSEKDRSKFFGIISIYRGETLPPAHQFQMIILQMLFEWFVLKQSMLDEDFNSIQVCLKSNLEQGLYESNHNSNFSLRMTESCRLPPLLRIHNHECTQKIGREEFIKDLNQAQEYQQLYVEYMHIVGESICKLKQSKRKTIKTQALKFWAGAYFSKINQNLREAKGQLFKKISTLRQSSLDLFSRHSF